MPTIDTKLKTALINVAIKLLTAQANKFQSMLLKMKDDYLVKLQEEGINQIAEKGPTIVCPIIIPEIEKILPKLNTLRGIVSNMDKLAGTINDITTKIDKPIQVVNTVIPVLELLPAPIPPGLPISVILGVNKAIDTLKKILDGLETGVNSLSTTSGIIVKYVIILDNLLQTIQTTLEQIINLCASNFNAEQEAALINNIRNALLFDPENANSTLEEDTAVDDELEEQLKNGDLVYQGFKLTIEYDPTPTTLLPSKRIIATGLSNTAVEILVEGGEADIPIEGIKLYYPEPLPLTEEEIQELQGVVLGEDGKIISSQGSFYDSSYTYSSNNTTLITLIKNKIDNYLNGKTEDYVRYKVTFNYEQPDFRGQIQSQIDWLQNWQNQHTQLDLSELIKEGQDLLGEIPNVFASLYINPEISDFGVYYGGTPLENGSVLNLPPGKVKLLYAKNLTFWGKYTSFLADKKLSNSNPTITSGNSILSEPILNYASISEIYELNVINASTINIIVETTGTKRGEDYYNFDNFPNEGAIPFEEVPENIDITKAPQIREYDGDEYSKGFYAWDVQEKRWELLDLKPFGYIEGIKNGDWKVYRKDSKNTYYEWYAGKYRPGSGRLDEDLYPKWVKKNSDDWKIRIGAFWWICGDWGELYNILKPTTPGTDETCVIYYISNEQQNPDKDNPINTLRGVIWKWDEELVQWFPQNIGTALTYTDPSINSIWNKGIGGFASITANDIPDGGKWATILQSDVDNALINAKINDTEQPPQRNATALTIIPTLKKIRDSGSFKYDNLSKNNFDEEQIRLARKLFEAR